jgi:valyl-tRNA synthetase
MEIQKQYNPGQIEDKWYKTWMERGYFRSLPDEREPFTIVIPPPNVTGVLHMGHMLNNTIQDVLIRRARMQGKNACWVPGTDHASIATEAKVVNKLRAEGIEKNDLSRDEFMKHAWEWKEKHGGIILEQLKKLGASCDWERTKFTMDAPLSEAVIDVFIDLFNKGLVYRGIRMVNWDPKAQTALSDEEVIHKETLSKLYYVRYRVLTNQSNTEEYITIATTRPETILGDSAICVHPDDERYKDLIGKQVMVPLINREIPVIADKYVDREFGTGALKITPAHDINDYTLGIRHNLPTIDVISSDGTMSESARLYVGLDRFEARKRIIEDLAAAGQLVKTEEIANKVGHSERTDSVIEPRLSQQWFVKMESLAKPALAAVLEGKVKVYPPKFVNTYKHWMENVKDWCISRQLWWGQQIPAWYDGSGDFVVGRSKDEAIAAFAKKGKQVDPETLVQDEDVLDTWFSSWLWPISVFDPKAFSLPREQWNADINYYYPTNDLVTAPEILFFWVARMIMAGEEFCGEVPFKNVYLTGIVRDKQGRKMSKSLGNSPDPIELINRFGADGVRMGMLLTSPAGNDLPFDESLCEQGRNFNNKIWNAFRLINSWESEEYPQPESSKQAISWFKARLTEELENINDLFSKFRISEALMSLYKLTWDDFCAWYLEAVKPAYQQPIDSETLRETILLFEDVLRMLHPFMPFITEEIWHFIRERSVDECLIVNHMPESGTANPELLAQVELVKEVVASIRTFRNSKGIAPKEPLVLLCKSRKASAPLPFEEFLKKLANVSELNYISEPPTGSFSLIVRVEEFYIQAADSVDVEAEKEKLEKELTYTRGFLNSVVNKLNNERFISNAKPEIVENEKQKQADALHRIKVLEEQLNALA